MDVLPSYEEATLAPDWLQLAAPYLTAADWRRGCLVNSQWYHQFAPRLWLDPLITVRDLGLHPNDDLAWYRHFVGSHVHSVRPSTRALVRSLDFRHFAVLASGLYSTEASERAISESFKQLPQLFPRLVCLLLDGHPELDPGSLVSPSPNGSQPTNQPQNPLQLLDLSRCRHELSSKIFLSEYFRDLVYLDVSFIPGSIKSAAQNSLNPEFLPELRVLKVQGREMVDSTASALFQAFGLRLWSLDVSHNNLTDGSLDDLLHYCFSSISFRSDTHFATEGRLVRPQEVGSRPFGTFDFIEESDYSFGYHHPQRYFADAPLYSKRADQEGLQEWQVQRSNGLDHRKRDDAEGLKNIILSDAIEDTATTANVINHSVRSTQGGLTHLYLSGNKFTNWGISKVMRASSGRLQHVECESCRFLPQSCPIPANLPTSLEIHGLFGLEYLSRPVYSSNLRSLRVHHSVVTNIPTVGADGLAARAAYALAETTFHERVRMAYPKSLVPDTNPRLRSLTLTGIPTRSIGPMVLEITKFLHLATLQQRKIKEAKRLFHGRGPSLLSGLRHIRLELDPDPSADEPSLPGGSATDFDELLDPTHTIFVAGDPPHLLGDDSWGITTRRSPDPSTKSPDPPLHSANGDEAEPFSYSEIDGEYIQHRVEARDSWNGNVFTIPVWIGPGPGSATAGKYPTAVKEYMANLRDRRLHALPGPASPIHVAAGVPSSKTYIFHAAWDRIVLPKLPLIPFNHKKSAFLAQMRDVAAAIREYRARTCGTPDHWDGQLELVHMDRAARYHSSEYWR
ncbi:uncharacterized protein PG998_010008 [Apiospora kogelbergensis]|uniref:uncharacterized protein n=1 Tax=Apiospora kogelbergensis TaxID=1337665 RepID=UPI00312EB719